MADIGRWSAGNRKELPSDYASFPECWPQGLRGLHLSGHHHVHAVLMRNAEGIAVEDIAKEYQPKFNHPIVVAKEKGIDPNDKKKDRKKSKFSEKYSERIKSIKES